MKLKQLCFPYHRLNLTASTHDERRMGLGSQPDSSALCCREMASGFRAGAVGESEVESVPVAGVEPPNGLNVGEIFPVGPDLK